MKRIRILRVILTIILTLVPLASWSAEPLRVFIRAGVKTHGPNQHDHPRFLSDWTQLLGERGMKVDGSLTFPSAQQLDNSDVVVVYAADGMKITGEQREVFERFLKRGGGVVVIHDGVVSGDQHEWAKKVQGGAWVWNDPARPNLKTKWYEGEVGIYFVDTNHPITRGISNYDWKDEIYHDLDMAPDAQVLATSFHSVFVIAPQVWTYEKTWDGGSKPYRAFVSLPGHEYDVFRTPHYRAILLRGIAWAGWRSNVDEYCRAEELGSLKYPEGGPTAPEKAASKLSVHPDFTINLVASEPLVEKVMSLDWDPKGRLWVAETPEYPNGRTINRNDLPIHPQRALNPDQFQGTKENRPARDRISWLEDTNGDGQFDRKHVFYDGLELVTSLVFYRDGVIVAQAPDILWLRDTDGDGKAEKVEKLYTGFGTGDTHAVINNFRWGLDGWVYSAIGYSAGFPKSGDGSRDFGRVTAGVIRFKPDGSALEQYASGRCNTWGFDFAPDGEAFYTTATCGEHLLHIVMPETVLAKGNVGNIRASSVIPDHQKVYPNVHHTRPAYVQIDWVGMFTAASGACIYNGGAWPSKYDGNHFLSEPTVSLVHQDLISPKGVSYAATKDPERAEREFIAGSDLWFRPIHTRVGPDGALYVVDFYNQAAIHNDTRGPAHGAHNAATRPDRDHHFARIWRVQHKAAKALAPWKFDAQEAGSLVKMLEHPNGWVRDTAARLLREQGGMNESERLAEIVKSDQFNVHSRVAALYTLGALGAADGSVFGAAARDANPALRKAALKILSERDNSDRTPSVEAVTRLINDPEPRVRLQALIALGTCRLTPELAEAVVATWPTLRDPYLESAAIGVAAKEPLMMVEACFKSTDPAFVTPFVSHVVRLLAMRQDAAVAARLVTMLSGQPARLDTLKQAALESLGANLRQDVTPAWSTELSNGLKALLKSEQPGLPGAALPLAARWDQAGSLKTELGPAIATLGAKLHDANLPVEQRAQIAANLLGVRKVDPQVVNLVGRLLERNESVGLQKRIVEALGSTGDPAAGTILVGAYPNAVAELREPIFGELVKRADWSLKLIDDLANKRIEPLTLGPANLFRLRTHPDKGVASKANGVLDLLKGPEQKQKEELIARLRSEIEKAGNVGNGRKLYTANCASCHVYKDEGVNMAPNLTGMGAHGAADLLVHILDPNRVVEPNFVSVSVETKDDLSYDGIVERENAAELVIRNATGVFTIPKSNIQSRRSTGRSLMPEGFEALGAEGLRDLIAYLTVDDVKYRILDLSLAYTANTSRGLYYSEEARDQTLRFQKFGLIKFNDIPFEIGSPAKSPTGNNVIVLKGGEGFAKTRPQRVEIPVGVPARKIHFLGAGGWAYPYGGENQKNRPVLKAVLQFKGGGTEEIVIRNGVEIADYIGSGPNYDVPGSQRVPDAVQRGQVRWFAKEIKGTGLIEKLILESYDNLVAPTITSITVELPADAAPKASASAE